MSEWQDEWPDKPTGGGSVWIAHGRFWGEKESTTRFVEVWEFGEDSLAYVGNGIMLYKHEGHILLWKKLTFHLPLVGPEYFNKKD